jgi:hypothetical protein
MEKVPLRDKAGKQLITDMRIAAEKVLRGELAGKPARTVRDGRVTHIETTFKPRRRQDRKEKIAGFAVVGKSREK